MIRDDDDESTYYITFTSPADCADMLNNTSPNENEKIVTGIKNRIFDLKERIKKEWAKKKKI